MQLVNICTNAIELFGAAYFVVALAVHLQHCWANPHAIELKRFDRKLAAVEAIAPATESPTPLLLSPAPIDLLHPFEMSLERMSAIEPIAAEWLDAEGLLEAIDLPPVEVDRPDYARLSSAELRKLCSDRGIRWRGVKAGKHLSKPEMIAVLS